jgi:hypothetical protein
VAVEVAWHRGGRAAEDEPAGHGRGGCRCQARGHRGSISGRRRSYRPQRRSLVVATRYGGDGWVDDAVPKRGDGVDLAVVEASAWPRRQGSHKSKMLGLRFKGQPCT